VGPNPLLLSLSEETILTETHKESDVRTREKSQGEQVQKK
jgi:hypothetical protein